VGQVIGRISDERETAVDRIYTIKLMLKVIPPTTFACLAARDEILLTCRSLVKAVEGAYVRPEREACPGESSVCQARYDEMHSRDRTRLGAGLTFAHTHTHTQTPTGKGEIVNSCLEARSAGPGSTYALLPPADAFVSEWAFY